MEIILTPDTLRLVEECIRRGGYASADEAFRAAFDLLEEDMARGEFEPGEMERIIQEGEQSGEAVDGELVFAQLRELRAEQRSRVG